MHGMHRNLCEFCPTLSDWALSMFLLPLFVSISLYLLHTSLCALVKCDTLLVKFYLMLFSNTWPTCEFRLFGKWKAAMQIWRRSEKNQTFWKFSNRSIGAHHTAKSQLCVVGGVRRWWTHFNFPQLLQHKFFVIFYSNKIVRDYICSVLESNNNSAKYC